MTWSPRGRPHRGKTPGPHPLLPHVKLILHRGLSPSPYTCFAVPAASTLRQFQLPTQPTQFVAHHHRSRFRRWVFPLSPHFSFLGKLDRFSCPCKFQQFFRSPCYFLPDLSFRRTRIGSKIGSPCSACSMFLVTCWVRGFLLWV